MDAEAIEDLFRPIGRVTIKRMFGGKGIYADGVMFALETGGEIFLKTDDETRPAFEAAGLRPFIYKSPRGPTATSYWLLADAAHDDEDELRCWCELALTAARRKAAATPKKIAVKAGARKAPAKRA